MQFPPLLRLLLIPEQKEKPSELEQQLKKAEAAQRRRMQVEKAARESEVCFCVILFHSLSSFFISYVRSNRNISVWIESCRVRLSEKFLVKSLAGKNGKINLKSARENWHRYCIRLDEFSLFSIWF